MANNMMSILLKGCHKNAVRDVFSLSDKVKKVSSMWILLAKKSNFVAAFRSYSAPNVYSVCT